MEAEAEMVMIYCLNSSDLAVVRVMVVRIRGK